MRHRIAAGVATVLLLVACSPSAGDGRTEEEVVTTVGEQPADVAPGTVPTALPEAPDDSGASAEDEVTTTTSTTSTTAVPAEAPDLDEELGELESELTALLDELDDLLAGL